ncbi:hypothetical protein [Roseivivax sp. CAU 1761]
MSGVGRKTALILGGVLIAGTGAALGLWGGWAVLWLGFVIGMAHALEADHLAAVAAMTGREDGPRRLILRGMAWGAGHTLALFAICATVIALGLTISGRLEAGLEFAVGLMIAGLGLRMLWRLRRDRVHIHVHEHDGRRHIHAHSHAGETGEHAASPHGHSHRAPGHLGTVGVGLVHGAAGSAGLLVLTVAATDSLAQAMAYCAIFGLGSLAGMAALSAAASLPLGLLERGASWMRPVAMAGIGVFAVWVGGSLAVESFGAL